jgi:hydrogenase/urease accessory protein HupE
MSLPFCSKRWRVPLLLVLLLIPHTSFSHILSFSNSELQVQSNRIDWTLQIHLNDFDRKFAQANESLIRDYIAQKLAVTRGNEPCTLDKMEIRKDLPRETVILPLSYTCPNTSPQLTLSYGLFFGDLGHRHLLKFVYGLKSVSYNFSPEEPEVSFSLVPSFWTSVKDFLILGFEHILTGYDHILFVLSLILGARRFKTLFWLVTSFTLAHSISLALAVFNLVHLPSRFVESAIAASIVFVAIRHLVWGEFKKAGADLPVTFFFGLIHGLGFSGALKEANLQSTEIITPLLSFNVGVELGQVLIIGAVFPLLYILRKIFKDRYPWVQRGSLVLIAAVGIYWMVQRILF